MKTPITIIGNLGGDPKLRVTAAGDSVAAFSVAVTDRVKDKRSGEWADGETTWYRVSAWRDLGENAAECLNRGQRVTVVGSVKAETWTDKDGNERTTFAVEADDIGLSVRFDPAYHGDSKAARAQTPAPLEPGEEPF